VVTAHALSPEAPAYKSIGQETLDNYPAWLAFPGWGGLGALPEHSSNYKNGAIGINAALKTAKSAIDIVDRSQTNKIKEK
jgi:hypothetical protein